MLCPTCESLDFSFLGYQESTAAVAYCPPKEDDAESHHDQDAVREGLYRSTLQRPPSLQDHDYSLVEILERKNSCHFCTRIAQIFEGWASRFWNGKENLDLTGSKVRFAERYFRTTTGSINHALKAVDVTIISRNPDFLDSDNEYHWTGLTHRFQRSSDKPLDIVELCDQLEIERQSDRMSSAWFDMDPYVGRLRPQQADFRLFKEWKSLCHKTHDKACSHLAIYNDKKPHLIRLIDVENMCIVTVSDNAVQWVALSYVWGSRLWKYLTQDSLLPYEQPGALAGNWLPATIGDAIEVTKQIGERYLWTDGLCIIQDSPEDKAVFIQLMDVIYGTATITIVALAGESAFDGLPGVRPESRSPLSEPIKLRGACLMDFAYLNAVGFEDVRIEQRGIYPTRGWTFQEHVLSRRLLIFTPQVIFWECQKGTWREDSNWEIVDAPQRNIVSLYESSLDLKNQDLWNPDASAFDQSYQALVYNYTRRQLKYEKDYFAAFEGILASFERTTGIEFTWGLPKPFLGVALTWPMDYSPGKVARLSQRCSVTTSRGIVEVEYPSWSWMGWIGPSMFEELFGVLTSEHAGLEFFMFSESRNDLRHIEQNRQFTPPRVPSGGDHNRAAPNWRGDTTRKVTREDLPDSLFRPNIYPLLLTFWTSCAKLRFDFQPPPDPLDRFSASLHDEAGNSVHSGWDQFPDFLAPGQHNFMFLIVGRDSLEDIRPRSQLVAFMVEKHESGAWVRKSSLTLIEEEWNCIEHKSWDLVCLI